MFGQDNSVVQFDPEFDYDRGVTMLTLTPTQTTNGQDNTLTLKADYKNLVGIAVYDASSDIFQFTAKLETQGGEILQNNTPRQSWVLAGSAGTDVNSPESHHYKKMELDYSETGDQTLNLFVKNNTGVAFGSNLILYVVLLTRKPKKASN